MAGSNTYEHRHCRNCQRFGLCRKYKMIFLCVEKCYRKRRSIVDDLESIDAFNQMVCAPVRRERRRAIA